MEPAGEQGIIQMEPREEGNYMYVVRIVDIEGIVHLIALEEGRLWLGNDRIDLRTWNELFV